MSSAERRSPAARWVSGPLAAFGLGLAVLSGPVHAQPAAPAASAVPSQARPSIKPPAEQGVRWREMKPAQQAALKPLEREWPGIEASHKQKWLELSTRFPKMAPAEQARIQERMTEWARLTPQQRGNARLHFQELKQLPPAERQARWEAYQALTPEQKAQLAARAAQPVPIASGVAAHVAASGARATGPRVVGPTVVQARPGVTTTSITRRPAPPTHQQAGSPAIAATPGLVNRATLLPQRGPQGPAVRSAAGASAPAPLQ